MPAGMTVAGGRTSVFAAEILALPKGYTGLPRAIVRASQRRRLVHGVTIAVADKGLAAVTITDVTERAGVSKKTFYDHFPDKLACFLAAYDHGSAAMLEEVARAAATARDEGLTAIEQLRAGTRAYLEFLVFEETYARVFALEVLAAGPAAVARHRGCRDAFAHSLEAWHELNRPDHPGWPAAAPLAFEAATGMVYEVSSARIATRRVDELLALTEPLVGAQLGVLGIPAL